MLAAYAPSRLLRVCRRVCILRVQKAVCADPHVCVCVCARVHGVCRAFARTPCARARAHAHWAPADQSQSSDTLATLQAMNEGVASFYDALLDKSWHTKRPRGPPLVVFVCVLPRPPRTRERLRECVCVGEGGAMVASVCALRAR